MKEEIIYPLTCSRKEAVNPYKKISPNVKFTLILVLLFSLMRTPAWAHTEAALSARNYNLVRGLALSGYDPVAYFSQHKAMKGNNSVSFTYNGAAYYFSSIENLEIFKKNPSQYVPQYGGWCAYAMATKGEKVEIDPETFKIIKGRLYLFYNRLFNNTLTSWNKDEAGLLPKADTNWNKIIKQ